MDRMMRAFDPGRKQASQPAAFLARGRADRPALAQPQREDAAVAGRGHDFSRLRIHADPPARPSGLPPASTGTASGDGADPEPGVAQDAGTPGAQPLGDLPGDPRACVLQSAMPYSRGGIVRSPGGSVGEEFEVRVEWDNAPRRGEMSYCAAECGEYHQFIRGHMLSSAHPDGRDPTDVSPRLFGGLKLDEKDYREDGRDNNPQARYGHRKEPRTMNEEYLPDRAAGTRYIGKDFPNVSIGTWADIDISFEGRLVDTCKGTETKSEPWRIVYKGLIRP